MTTGTILLNVVFLAGVAVFLLFIGWLFWLLFTGRGRKGRAQHAEFGDLPAAPDNPGEVIVGPSTGLYVGTSRADDWVDRVQIDDLGDRAKATVTGYTHGIAVERRAASTIWIPAESLTAVRITNSASGKVVHGGGLLALDWTLAGGTGLTTALRGDDKRDYPHWLAAYPGAATDPEATDPETAE
ncbi:hypothetical protein [Gordonia sp. (in: high G+C Gram-positive bacteria)]|uniref:PH-like domain-containing protein n=1 Tax=Gordonia sp. (in: high G+C Gram-positive bacteria) TaxID=84139 RepID=UPI0039E4D346